MARPPLQQLRIRNESFMRAGVTARHHQVEDAQILEPESVARGHDRACHLPSWEPYRTEDEHVNERKSGRVPAVPPLGRRHREIRIRTCVAACASPPT